LLEKYCYGIEKMLIGRAEHERGMQGFILRNTVLLYLPDGTYIYVEIEIFKAMQTS
jgi:hypothetical protein